VGVKKLLDPKPTTNNSVISKVLLVVPILEMLKEPCSSCKRGVDPVDRMALLGEINLSIGKL